MLTIFTKLMLKTKVEHVVRNIFLKIKVTFIKILTNSNGKFMDEHFIYIFMHAIPHLSKERKLILSNRSSKTVSVFHKSFGSFHRNLMHGIGAPLSLKCLANAALVEYDSVRRKLRCIQTSDLSFEYRTNATKLGLEIRFQPQQM